MRGYGVTKVVNNKTGEAYKAVKLADYSGQPVYELYKDGCLEKKINLETYCYCYTKTK